MRRLPIALTVSSLLIVCSAAAQRTPPLRDGLPSSRVPDDQEIRQRLDQLQLIPLLLKSDAPRQQKAAPGMLSALDAKAPAKAMKAYEKGNSFLHNGDLPRATEQYLKAIAAFPPFVAAHNNVGVIYLQQGNYPAARRHLEAAVAPNPRIAAPYLNLCRASLALHDDVAARNWITRAREIDPRNAEILSLAALALYRNREYSDSIAAAREVHTLPHREFAMAHMVAAASFVAERELDGAESEYRIFLQEDADNAAAAEARAALAKIEVIRGKLLRESQFVPEQFEEGAQVLSVAGGAAEPLPDPAPGREPPMTGVDPRPLDRPSGTVLKAHVDEVLVLFTADHHGRPVAGLTRDDIVVLDDRRPPRAVVDFRTEADLPLRIGLLIDTSNSTRERFDFEKRAAVRFISSVLTGRSDFAFAGGFANHARVTQDFTGDIERLSEGIQRLQSGGGTGLWDAVAAASAKLASGANSDPVARMLVLVTDGEDNSSRLSMEDAIQAAERAGVLVYVVSTDLSASDEARLGSRSAADHNLETLAQRTGGWALFPGSLHNLDSAFASLRENIRNRYSVSYRPEGFVPDGRYHTISIEARQDGKKLRVRTRPGYYATAEAASATPATPDHHE